LLDSTYASALSPNDDVVVDATAAPGHPSKQAQATANVTKRRIAHLSTIPLPNVGTAYFYGLARKTTLLNY
jgi:hypothetical protein